MNHLKTILPPLLIFLLSLPLKLVAAQNMPFDIDIVPVLARHQQYLLTPVGTLSSVAAYNMPMLEWLHLPAFYLTQNAWWAIFLTMTLFNLLGTMAVFKLSADFFGKGAAWAATAFFSFSEVGISSSYTAWAQLLLPSFFALTLWAMWQWHIQQKGYYLALAGIIATAAFMTHFSAILLYPAMLFFALVNRSRWQWRWLAVGGAACFLLLSPYLLFEMQRDFIDLRAFLNQKMLVAPEVLEQYRPYSRPNQNNTNTQNQTASTSENQNTQPASSRIERGLNYLLSLPKLLLNALLAAFPTTSRSLGAWAGMGQIVFAIPMLFFWLGLPLALWRRDEGAKHYGRIGLFIAVILLAMSITRNLDDITYLMGFMSLQTVMAAYAIAVFLNGEKFRFYRVGLIFGLVLLFCGFQVAERLGRLASHDDEVFSAYNISLYRHIDAAAAAIAADWQGGDSLTVSYDILPEMPNLWWTPAWNSIDPSYRMGMNFDFLLEYQYSLHNLNQDALGTVPNADYIVIYAPAAEHYNLADYKIWQFGAIWVLKP